MAKKRQYLPYIVTIGTLGYLVTDLSEVSRMIGISYWKLMRGLKGNGYYDADGAKVYHPPVFIKTKRHKIR